MTDYEKRQADWTKREQGKEGALKVGEVRGKVTRDIRRGSSVRVRIDDVETLTFSPSVDLAKGDSIIVVIEKV
jgi:hypothetical protein